MYPPSRLINSPSENVPTIKAPRSVRTVTTPCSKGYIDMDGDASAMSVGNSTATPTTSRTTTILYKCARVALKQHPETFMRSLYSISSLNTSSVSSRLMKTANLRRCSLGYTRNFSDNRWKRNYTGWDTNRVRPDWPSTSYGLLRLGRPRRSVVSSEPKEVPIDWGTPLLLAPAQAPRLRRPAIAAGRTDRRAPSARRGYPSPLRRPGPSPQSGPRCEWWTGGGR